VEIILKNQRKLKRLVKWANASFDVSCGHVWRNVFDDIVDLEVSDASLIVVSSIDASDLGEMWMTADEQWSSGVELSVLLGIADVRLR
jgi:hypothetical protein